jgi:hypothetical protein
MTPKEKAIELLIVANAGIPLCAPDEFFKQLKKAREQNFPQAINIVLRSAIRTVRKCLAILDSIQNPEDVKFDPKSFTLTEYKPVINANDMKLYWEEVIKEIYLVLELNESDFEKKGL